MESADDFNVPEKVK